MEGNAVMMADFISDLTISGCFPLTGSHGGSWLPQVFPKLIGATHLVLC